MIKEHDEARQGESFSPAPKMDSPSARKFYIESYGCAMNFADSEVVASILQDSGFTATRDFTEADLVLINTCSIREKAEQQSEAVFIFFGRQKDPIPQCL